ncbi:MAG: hypothetical protein G01um101413_817 [Parcubacteria group bacterium Gr01-1014_13]|nr:MAG: hypothetical protein G01um101413_817 [Parcubacteria group bacterium Gr01-1014_13]
MNMLALYIALGIIVYLNTGYWGGHLSRKIWGKEKRSFGGFLCFPASFCKNCIGNKRAWNTSSGNNLMLVTEEDYEKILAVAWPIKLVLNLIVIISIGTYCTVKTGFTLVTNPFAFFPKRKPKELLAAPLPAAPPAEPTLIQSDSYSESKHDEYQRILTRHNQDAVRLKELESKFQKENKVIHLPKRM